MSFVKTLPIVICLIFTASFTQAGIRAPGKYCGVVVFDRWDGCTLYSGVYVMYISEGEKEKLREHAGQFVQIDAKEVSQPINPGDGLITDLEYLNSEPRGTSNWKASASELALRAEPDFKDGEKPSIIITLTNQSEEDVRVFGSDLAPTLLMKDPADHFVADGPSYALLTRNSFIVGGSEARTNGSGFTQDGAYSWQIDEAVPVSFDLAPEEEIRVRITFDMPPGEYEFLAGYGGDVHEEECLASNRVAFNVTDEGGRLVEVEQE
jgi:hypothetical protein